MKYLLDTCLISELVKREPNRKVVAWLDGRDERSLFLSVLTMGELQKGVSKLADGDRKAKLRSWLEYELVERFEERILDVDLDTALAWGRLQGEAERKGVNLPVMDSLIAATATAHGLSVATRNVKGLKRCSAKVFNPWESEEKP